MMHYAVIDLGYGDAGKGIVTARLCATRDIDWVIRFSGGCQAAHNVITDDGRHHTFAQFGAGTFSGVKTFLSKYMLVEPFSLINEAEHLAELGVKDPLKMVVIDPDALITTPYHWELNQWKEDQRGDSRHGSTGRGIGMTSLFALEYPDLAPRMNDLCHGHAGRLRKKLGILMRWCISMGCPPERLPGIESVVERYKTAERKLQIMKLTWHRILRDDQVVFEGSQGVLLDQDHGFHPYTTWSKTTDANVYEFLRDASREDVAITTIGVVRSYMTRHGAGPFVSEVEKWKNTNEAHNQAEHYQGNWRVGYQDLVALRYAIECCTKIDYLYVTHLDAPRGFLMWANVAYETEDGELKLQHLVGREARPERQIQTEALLGAKSVLVPNEWWQPAESLSAALELPLYGKGWGPKIGQGAIQWD